MNPKVYVHLKTGNQYLVIHRGLINATNAQNGQRMVLYTPYVKDRDHVPWYIREESEFDAKFREIGPEDQTLMMQSIWRAFTRTLTIDTQ